MTKSIRHIRFAQTQLAKENVLTRHGDRRHPIAQLERDSGVPIVRMFDPAFPAYFFWLMSGIPPMGLPSDTYFTNEKSDALAWQQLYGPPLSFPMITPYLKRLLGEEIEDFYEMVAVADDYQYLADILKLGLSSNPTCAGVEHARAWLIKEADRLEAARPVISPLVLNQEVADTPQTSVKGFTWLGKPVELAELGYALLESGKVEASGQREQFIQALATFFGTPIHRPANVIGKVKGRKSNKSTIIDKLKAALDNFLSI
jgi:hypothetical protein